MGDRWCVVLIKGSSKLVHKDEHRRTVDRWYMLLKKVAQNSILKMITRERDISRTWY